MTNKFSAITAKRPIGILRFNAEKMRDNGAPVEVIEQYLADNGVDFNTITAVPSPNEEERARLIESEKSGEWAEGQKTLKGASVGAQKAQNRADAWQGLLGAARSFGGGYLLNYADELESYLTGQPVEEIRKEQSDWSRRNPAWDIALGVTGGMVPLAVTGAGGALATGGAAGKSLGTRAGLGALYGAGTGAVAGSGAGEDGLANRLGSAGIGALFGGSIGAAAPLVIGGVGRSIGRIARGMKKGPSEKQISDFILDKVIAESGRPGAQAQRNASVLMQAVQDGDLAIQNSARNLQNKMLAMSAQRNPEIVELALNPNWTAETPSAQNIMRALTTDSKRAASEKFGKFVAQQPQGKLADVGLKDYFKKNPVAKTIVRANKRRLGYNRSPNELATYEGLQNIEDVLNRNLPKSLDNSRVVNRNAKILDAIEDLSALRESSFPGQRVMDATYRASVGGVNDTAQKTAQAYMSQLASGVANPTNLEVSLTGASKLGLKPYVRGRARELVLKGVLDPDVTSTSENILNRAGFSTYRTLEEQR